MDIRNDVVTKEMLLSWGCVHRDGREVLGAEVRKTYREYSVGQDIASIFVVLSNGRRIYAPRATEGTSPEGFSFAVRVAAEEEGVKDRFWKLVTKYPGCELVKKVTPDGREFLL